MPSADVRGGIRGRIVWHGEFGRAGLLRCIFKKRKKKISFNFDVGLSSAIIYCGCSVRALEGDWAAYCWTSACCAFIPFSTASAFAIHDAFSLALCFFDWISSFFDCSRVFLFLFALPAALTDTARTFILDVFFFSCWLLVLVPMATR